MFPPMQSRASAPQSLSPNVSVLGLVSLLMGMSSAMIYGVLPVFLVVVLGASTASVGFIEGIAEATTSFAKIFSGVTSDRIRRRKPLVVLGYALSAVNKLLFPIAESASMVLLARISDRVGKGVRDAPRDAFMTDMTPMAIRGSGFGLRLALYTIGAVLGPLAAMTIMSLSGDNFRLVFWLALIPGFMSVVVLLLWVKEEPRASPTSHWSADAVGGHRKFSSIILVGHCDRGHSVAGAVQPSFPCPEGPQHPRRCRVGADHAGRDVFGLFRSRLSVRCSRGSLRQEYAARNRHRNADPGKSGSGRGRQFLDDHAGWRAVGSANGRNAGPACRRSRRCSARTSARHRIRCLRAYHRRGHVHGERQRRFALDGRRGRSGVWRRSLVWFCRTRNAVVSLQYGPPR